MAFGGVAVFTPLGTYTGQGMYNVLGVTGFTLAALVATPPVRANADTGVLSSNRGVIDAVPANTTSLPAAFGKGEDDWTADDAESITVIAQDLGDNATRVVHYSSAIVANVNPAPAGSSIANANVEITIQNKGAGAVTALSLRVFYEHSIIR